MMTAHRFTGVARAIVSQRKLRNVGDGRLALECDEAGTLPFDGVGRIGNVRDRAMAVGEIIGRGKDGDHAGRGECGRCIDRADACVSVGRTDEGGVG